MTFPAQLDKGDNVCFVRLLTLEIQYLIPHRQLTSALLVERKILLDQSFFTLGRGVLNTAYIKS
jgi:hypothetical protein